MTGTSFGVRLFLVASWGSDAFETFDFELEVSDFCMLIAKHWRELSVWVSDLIKHCVPLLNVSTSDGTADMIASGTALVVALNAAAFTSPAAITSQLETVLVDGSF